MTTGFVFAYRALRADGAVEQGTLDVESTAAATVALTSRGLLPLEVRVARVSRQRARMRSVGLPLGIRTMLRTLARIVAGVAPPRRKLTLNRPKR